jgi:NAD(P)-dependent dehydrogenase (short-subunit alcohol dehydrogenase family)
VNVGSRASEAPSGGAAAYAASKAAVAALTRSLAEEVRADGIQVNAVLPSIIDTPANRRAMPDAATDRWVKPADIARIILWLASAENRQISGALIPVYGNT